MAPWLQRLLTRLTAILPAVIIIIIAGDKATYQLLIYSQVALSMQLPFAVVPLVKFCRSSVIMGEFRISGVVFALSALVAGFIAALNICIYHPLS
jgi:manganese transport protein